MKYNIAALILSGALAVLQPAQATAKRLADFLPQENRAPRNSPAKPTAAKTASKAPPRQAADPRLDLEAHGIKGGTKELINFLSHGIPQERQGRLPEEPAEKCQLAIDAMARLAHARSQEALPLLLQIAAMQPPKGVESLLEMDLARTSPQSRADYRATALRLLQFNAVNAIGLIGSPDGLEMVRAVYAQETSPAARIQYALSLACMGDASGLGFLVEQIELQNRRESAAAARVFTMITGEDFDYTEHTAKRARRSRARQYRDWLKQNGARFVVSPSDVMKRRLEPRSPLPYQPRNTRDLLKLAACYFDFENKLGSRDARVRIKQAGRAMNSELQRISLDPNEDLNIRIEAMNWYFEINRTDARSLMQRLRRDENPEIEDKANALLEQMDDGSALAQPMTLGQ